MFNGRCLVQQSTWDIMNLSKYYEALILTKLKISQQQNILLKVSVSCPDIRALGLK